MRTFRKDQTAPEGDWKNYRKIKVVRMLQMDEDFVVDNREAENFAGKAGDYLVEDGYGGFYVCGKEFHEENYEEV